MKKIILFLILFSSLYQSSLAGTDDLTIPTNGYCIEDSHIGSNDCNRVFSHILTNGIYWQNDSLTGHYVGFHFNSIQKITSYSIINVNNDPTLKMTGWRFQALSDTGSWITLDTQYSFPIIYGIRYNFDIISPMDSREYRIIVDYSGVDGILITDIQMFSNYKINTFSSDSSFTRLGFSENDGSWYVDTNGFLFLLVLFLILPALWFTIYKYSILCWNAGFLIFSKQKFIGKK